MSRDSSPAGDNGSHPGPAAPTAWPALGARAPLPPGALADALGALSAFESVGVTTFVPIFRDELTGGYDASVVDAAALRASMGDLLRRNAGGGESFMIRVRDEALIQLDDCDTPTWERLVPHAFFSALTSPGRYHVWLCAAEAGEHRMLRRRLLAALRSTGAEMGPLATRWPGSLNRKPRRRQPDGSFPRVRLASIAPGRRVRAEELEQAGLLAPVTGARRAPARRLLGRALLASGLARAGAWGQRRDVLVLRYAGVTRQPDCVNPYTRARHARAGAFAAQLDHLQRGYQVVPLRSCIEALERGTALPERAVVLTFSEGYRNFLTVAAPLLRERGMPATLFLPPARVRAEGHGLITTWSLVDDEMYLSWSEVTALHAQGFDIGVALLVLTDRGAPYTLADRESELRDARDQLGQRVGVRPVLGLRQGEYYQSLARMAEVLGYAAVLGCGDVGLNAAGCSRYALHSTFARRPGADDLASFAAHTSGLTRWWWRISHQRIVAH